VFSKRNVSRRLVMALKLGVWYAGREACRLS
jgi:hypothetical protein